MCRSLGAKNLEFKAERLHYRAQQRSSLTIAGEPADPLFFSGRPASVVWHASAFSKPERLQSVASLQRG